jgi:hypothetical protein
MIRKDLLARRRQDRQSQHESARARILHHGQTVFWPNLKLRREFDEFRVRQ